MNKLVILILSLLSMSFWGCESENTSHTRSDLMEPQPVSPTNSQKAKKQIDRKLIKDGHVEFETKNIEATRDNIFAAVKTYEAYVSSDREFKSNSRISNTLVIRVPAENFDVFLSAATRDIDHFNIREIKVMDVTEQFVDVKARLKTKKELENRFLELLARASNVSEIIEIEKNLSDLRTEIESIEGRLEYLKNQIAFSTLSMNFYKTIPTQMKFGRKIGSGFKNGWNNLIRFFILLINIWPFVLITAGLVFGIKVYKGKK